MTGFSLLGIQKIQLIQNFHRSDDQAVSVFEQFEAAFLSEAEKTQLRRRILE